QTRAAHRRGPAGPDRVRRIHPHPGRPPSLRWHPRPRLAGVPPGRHRGRVLLVPRFWRSPSDHPLPARASRGRLGARHRRHRPRPARPCALDGLAHRSLGSLGLGCAAPFRNRAARLRLGLRAARGRAYRGLQPLARRCAASAGDEFEVAPLIRWRPLALGMGLTASVLLWLAVMLEITTWWWGAALPGQLRIYQVEAFRQGSQFSYSIWTMLFGAGLILTGFWRRLPTLRWEGLVALALAIGKVFVWDTADLSQGYRIACFLGLGALLLGISFVYQRDWLNLRRTESGD